MDSDRTQDDAPLPTDASTSSSAANASASTPSALLPSAEPHPEVSQALHVVPEDAETAVVPDPATDLPQVQLEPAPAATSKAAKRASLTSEAASVGSPDVRHAAASNNAHQSTPTKSSHQHNSTPSSKSKPPAAPSSSAISSNGSRRQLGPWTLGKTLGAGSMGKVKLAVNTNTGEKAAVKIIPRFTSYAALTQQAAAHKAEAERKQRAKLADGGGSDAAAATATSSTAAGAEGSNTLSSPTKTQHNTAEAASDKFQPSASEVHKAQQKDLSKEMRTIREASIQLLLHHPYICGMVSMHVYPNHYYLVCEWIHGGQMLDYIISHGRLRERAARKFARQIASALEYCHANSIVHRDLKIENILISKTGNIKIIDFGLSNLYSQHAQLSTFCGSLYFAAPELLNAKPYTGPEVDLWSFGIVLYVLVCGKVPFDDQSMPALHAKIKRGLVEYPTWLSAECKHLLSRLLVTNPSARATMSEIVQHPWMTKGYDGPPASHLPHREPLHASDLDMDIINKMSGFDFGSPDEVHAKMTDILTSDLYQACVRAWELRRTGNALGGDVAFSPTGGISHAGSSSSTSSPRSPHSKRMSGFDFYRKKLATGMASVLSGKHDDDASSHTDGTPTSGLVTASGVRPEQLDPTRGYHQLLSVYYLVKEKQEREKVYGPGVFASSTLSLNGPPLPPAPAQAHHAPATADPFQSVPSAPPTAARMPLPASFAPGRSTPTPSRTQTTDGMPEVMADDAGRRSLSVSRTPKIPASAPSTPNTQSGFGSPVPPAAHRPLSPDPAGKRASIHLSDRRRSMVASDNAAAAAAAATSAQEEQPPLTPTGSLARRFGSLLGRATSLNEGDGSERRHRHRSSISGPGHRMNGKGPVTPLPQVTEAMTGLGIGTPPNRSNTIDASSRSSRHARGVSVGTATTDANSSLARSVSLSTGANRRSSTVGRAGRPSTADGLEAEAFDEEDEEVLGQEEDEAQADMNMLSDAASTGRAASPAFAPLEDAKPVYLKGLFSVATTSTKPAAQIQKELVQALDRLGVHHRPLKSGFECVHAPSIDLRSVNSPQAQGFQSQTNLPAPDSPSAVEKRGVRRRGSRLAISRSPFGRDRENDRDLPSVPQGSQGSLAVETDHQSSASFTALGQSVGAQSGGGGHPDQSELFQSDGANPASDLVIRFDIIIVKVPWVPGIHGLQFRRRSGNAWSYSQLARQILRDSRL